MASFNDSDGVWRTISGRRVFIREGQNLGDAMKASGKFKSLKGKSGKVQSKKELFKERLKDITAKKDNETQSNEIEKAKRKINYQKSFGNDGTVYNQEVKISSDEKKSINDAIEKEIKNGYPNWKDYAGDKNTAKLYLEKLSDKSVNNTNNTTNRFIKNHLKDDKIKTDRNTRYSLSENKGNLSQGQKESLGSKYRSSLTKLNDKSIEDGTYDLDTGKKVDFGNKGYNVSFEQSSDKYTDSEYFDKIEECRKLCDGKVYGGKFGGAPEISFYTEDKETAMKIMEKYNQHSIYDNSIGDIIENSKYNAATNKVDYKEPSKFDMRKYDVEVKHDKGKSTISVVASNEDSAKKMVMNSEKAPERAILGVKDKGSIINKSTNETMNDAIRAKAGKKTKAFKEDLPKKVEIKEQGTSNRKEVSENIQAHILEYYDSPEDFVRQMDAMDYLPTKWHAGQEIAKGGSYLIYNGDMAEFLDSLKINPKGKKFSDDKAFNTYTSLIGRESAKLYNRIQRNSYNKYMKEHPASKMSFEEFKNMRKGD